MPGAEGPQLDQHSLLYLLTNICSELSVCQDSPALKGQQLRHFSEVKSQLGGPEEDGRDQNSPWPGHRGGWRLTLWERQQASSIIATGPKLLPFPTYHQWGRRKRTVTISPPPSGTPISLNLCHRPQSSPQAFVNPTSQDLQAESSTSLPSPWSLWGHPRTCDKG